MLKEKVIITSFAITQVGQIKHFQLKIPRDAKCIIGIEETISRIATLGGTGGGGTGTLGGGGGPAGGGTGGGTGPAIPFSTLLNPDTFLGDYRLQSCGDANIFYTAHLFLGDNNLAQGDFSANSHFTPKEYIHSTQRLESKVNEDGSATLLKGIYRDGQNPGATITYSYRVKIYLWYKQNCKEA